MKSHRFHLQTSKRLNTLNGLPMAKGISLVAWVALGLVARIGGAADFTLLEGAGTVQDISSNGNTLVGYRIVSEDPRTILVAWSWTRSNGLQVLGGPAGYESSRLTVTTGDASAGVLNRPRVVLGEPTAEPWYWTEENGWAALELPDDKEEGVVFGGISADGSVVAGEIDDTATIWVNGRATTTLQNSLNAVDSGTSGLSSDGSVVVGHVIRSIGQPREPYLWDADNGVTFLGSTFNGEQTFGIGLSSDGNVVFGRTGGDPGYTWRWTEQDSFVTLGKLPGLSQSRPYDANVDGSIIVGSAFRGAASERAFVWDQAGGMRDLRAVLEDEHGIQEVPSLHRAAGISDDGRVIAGYNTSGGQPTDGWVIQLDRPIIVTTGVLGDFNGNAELDVQDLDLLDGELQSNRNVALFDVNLDEAVNLNDRRHWIHSLANTYFGDSNLDGEFNSTDLVTVFEAGQYEDNVDGNSSWATGDWNGDGEFTSGDLVSAFQDGGYEQGPRPLVAVPEPHCHFILMIGCVLLFRPTSKSLSRVWNWRRAGHLCHRDFSSAPERK